MTRLRQKPAPLTPEARKHNERINMEIDKLIQAERDEEERFRLDETHAIVVRTTEALGEEGRTFEHVALIILRAHSISEAKSIAASTASTRYRCAYVAIDAFVLQQSCALRLSDPVWFDQMAPESEPLDAFVAELA